MNGNQTGNISDRDIAQDSLTMHKFMTDIANMGCIESASQAGQRAFEQIHRTELDHARKVFQLMTQRGWYSPQPAQQNSMMQGLGQNQQGLQQQRQF